MAFHNVGRYFLKPGESVRLYIRFGEVAGPEWGGRDMGAQWIMADPQTWGGHLAVTEHSKHRKPGHANPYVYSVRVINIGDVQAWFSLQGGGNV